MKCQIVAFIESLEKELLSASVRMSQQRLDVLIADDCVEIGSSGHVYSKKDLLSLAPRELSAINFQGMLLAEDVVLINYQVIDNGLVTLRSSIWTDTGNGWKLRFHQGTEKVNDSTA